MYSEQNKRCKCKVFNIIIELKESKLLVRHISCDYECRFNGKKCNSNQKWNKYKYRCECSKPMK